MTTSFTKRLAFAAAAGVVLGSPLLLVAPSQASTGLPCRASMSDSTPRQYSYVGVRVRTASYAGVHTVAHYKTTSTPHSGHANRQGQANISYYISGATPGYRVRVDVSVSKGGRTGHCSTSFVPHS